MQNGNGEKNADDSPIGDEETLYISASDQSPAEITIKLEKDAKRKITIISEVEPNQKRARHRTRSMDLRRQAMVNNALRSTLSTASSRSRSISRSRSRCRSPSRDRCHNRRRLLDRSCPRTASRSRLSRITSRSPSDSARSSRSSRSCSRSRSRSCSRSVPTSPAMSHNQSIPIQCKDSEAQQASVPQIRLPTHLNELCKMGCRANRTPDFIQLPSPLYILTEQQVVGASEKRTVQFVSKILLTSYKLTLDDRKRLYKEMVLAEYVGTSRSSSDLSNCSEEPEEDFQLKIYYSTKGIYIHSVQNVLKLRSGKTSTVHEDKSYTNICKTTIIGDHGKSADGFLNVSCQETVSVVKQRYTRSEQFKIGLKSSQVHGNVSISSTKNTFDPTKTINFSEDVMFDSKNIGIHVRHSATAEMKDIWSHQVGSFGEEQSEYRELKFFFDEHNETNPPGTLAKSIPPATTSLALTNISSQNANAGSPSSSSSNSKDSSTMSNSSRLSAVSPSSRKARSKAKRHKAMQQKSSSNSEKKIPSPDRLSSKKKERPDQEPIKVGSLQKVIKKNDENNNSSIYETFPQATSTPKTAVAQKPSENEVDLDKSLTGEKKRRSAEKSEKSTASRNLGQQVTEDLKKEEVRKDIQIEVSSDISTKPPASPGNSVYLYNAGSSSNTSTYMSTKDHKDHKQPVLSDSSTDQRYSPSPQGILRVKETKVIREVRQEDGKPPQVSEKKEETVKEEKVKLNGRPGSRSKTRAVSPSAPKLQSLHVQTEDEKVVTLSTANETRQTLEVIPIKVNDTDGTTPSTSTCVASQHPFNESVQVEFLIDKKRLVLNVNLVLLAEKKPEVEIIGFSFRGQKLWEKSSEWSISSAVNTSNTKTVARQASNIMEDDKKESSEKK